METKTMFVLKFIDPEYPIPGYITKGSILCGSIHRTFLTEYTFDTEEEARQHITTCLNSGWYRSDITEDNFEVVEVKDYPGFGYGFCCTEEAYYERYKKF